MNNHQLDCILEYLNDEEGEVTLEDTQLSLQEGFVNTVKKTISGFKPLKKGFLGGLFKKKTIDYQKVMDDLGLEKIEGKSDLFVCHKYKILGKEPYIHAALSFIAPYPNNMKLFLEWSNDAKWDDIFNRSFAERAKIDFTDVASDVKNKKLEAVYVTKGIQNGYVIYKCFACYSIKSKTLKNAKYHTAMYAFDGQYEYSGWSESDINSWDIADL